MFAIADKLNKFHFQYNLSYEWYDFLIFIWFCLLWNNFHDGKLVW